VLDLVKDRAMKRIALGLLVLFAAQGAVTAYAGFVDNIYRGLEILTTPLGGPLSTASDGTVFNGSRSGRVRIVPSGIGEGYQLELDRTFGVDSRGRAETLHLGGVADLTLSGPIQITAGYNGRGMFRTYRGEFGASNLGYLLRTKTGAQDATIAGTFNTSTAFEVNPLGFYNLAVDISNSNASYALDGVVIRDEQDMNFNVGPINIQGNIYYDMVLALLNSAGVDTSDLEELFPRSPIGTINEAIQDAIQQRDVVAGVSSENSHAALLARAVIGQDAGAAETLFADLAIAPSVTATADAATTPALAVPEPGALLLLTFGAGTVWYWRRRG